MVVRQLVVVNGSPSDAVAQFVDVVSSAIIGKNEACSHRPAGAETLWSTPNSGLLYRRIARQRQ
jgi:hypothetical protein